MPARLAVLEAAGLFDFFANASASLPVLALTNVGLLCLPMRAAWLTATSTCSSRH